MKKTNKNHAFIDGQNLNLGIQEMGWKLDYQRFRVYLKEKYGVDTAYYFIGYMEEYKDLYDALRKFGYILVFKEILVYGDNQVKGNIDAELVLQAMINYKKYKQAVIVSGDGDFACLVRYLNKNGKLKRVLVPNTHKYSALLKKAAARRLDSMNDLKKKLAYKKRFSKSASTKKAAGKKEAPKKTFKRNAPPFTKGGPRLPAGRSTSSAKADQPLARGGKKAFKKKDTSQKVAHKKAFKRNAPPKAFKREDTSQKVALKQVSQKKGFKKKWGYNKWRTKKRTP